MAFHHLERLINLHDGYRRVFQVGSQQLLLIQEDGRLYLLKNQCPHLGMGLSQATYREGRLRCPGHGIEFDLASGQPAATSQRCPALTFYTLSYEGNAVGVEVS